MEEIKTYVWVKASERLPENNDKPVFLKGCRIDKGFITKEDKGGDGYVCVHEDYYGNKYNITKWINGHHELHKVEWLDEQTDKVVISKERHEALINCVETLEKIGNWELPTTGKFWDEEKTRPTSFETEYGSNGAKNYIKALANIAFIKLTETSPK